FVGCSEASAYEKVDESKGGLLGMGTFGEVSRARHILSGQEVALKKIKIQANESHNGMPITAIREIKLLKRLSHPNVCPVVDMVYEPPSEASTGSGTVYMVLPYMEHDLNGLIERLDSEDKPFTPAQIKLYAKQLFEGTLYLHQNKILHRDIKAANILISNDGSLRIADFGLARPYHDPGAASGHVNYTGMVVTRWYRPPELLAGERRYGPAVDMWGLGCLLAEMIVRRPMFKGSSEINQLELIVDLCGSPGEDCYPGWTSLPGVKNVDNTGQIKADKNEKGRHDFGKKPRCVRENELADLIDRLLVLDPRKRLTAEGALAHKWFDVEPLPADP
ncbi:Pkinase-domain-containing protein, partial [Microstroma glucosiphilum]